MYADLWNIPNHTLYVAISGWRLVLVLPPPHSPMAEEGDENYPEEQGEGDEKGERGGDKGKGKDQKGKGKDKGEQLDLRLPHENDTTWEISFHYCS